MNVLLSSLDDFGLLISPRRYMGSTAVNGLSILLLYSVLRYKADLNVKFKCVYVLLCFS